MGRACGIREGLAPSARDEERGCRHHARSGAWEAPREPRKTSRSGKSGLIFTQGKRECWILSLHPGWGNIHQKLLGISNKKYWEYPIKATPTRMGSRALSRGKIPKATQRGSGFCSLLPKTLEAARSPNNSSWNYLRRSPPWGVGSALSSAQLSWALPR